MKTPNNFKKVSKAALADAIGDLDAQIKVMEDSLKAAKAEAKARGISEATGDRYTIKVISSNRVSLDKDAVIAKLGEKWVESHSKISSFEQVRVTALKSALIAEAA